MSWKIFGQNIAIFAWVGLAICAGTYAGYHWGVSAAVAAEFVMLGVPISVLIAHDFG